MSVPGGVVVVAEETREVHGSGGWICCFRLLVPLPCVRVSSLLFPSILSLLSAFGLLLFLFTCVSWWNCVRLSYWNRPSTPQFT